VEQTDELKQANISSVSQQVAPYEAQVREHSRLGLLWRYRVFIAGILSFGLALAGEILMRAPAQVDGAPPPATPSLAWLSSLLVAAAALLVGVVAWVNDGFRIGRNRNLVVAPAVETGTSAPIPVRTVRPIAARSGQATHKHSVLDPSTLLGQLRTLMLRYSVVRHGCGAGGGAGAGCVAGAGFEGGLG
jgi:hypothetical protein